MGSNQEAGKTKQPGGFSGACEQKGGGIENEGTLSERTVSTRGVGQSGILLMQILETVQI